MLLNGAVIERKAPAFMFKLTTGTLRWEKLDKIADYLTIMNNGKIFYTGLKDELFEKYCIAKGGIEDLTPDLEKRLIGIQKGNTGFSALLDVQDIKYTSNRIVTENATVDEILIHIDKGV